MPRRLEVRDPIHGFIYRTSEERDIIDTPLYQRLRNLYQLAMARLVYPGATHARFDHSLGAFHLATGLSAALVEDETERRLVRLAALLHDVGHGPFSHVAEPILKQYSDKEKLKEVKTDEEIHELITAQIIMCHPDLTRLLSDSQREHIVGLLQGTWGHRYLHEIVSGPVDADKQDYLLRDSHFTGVKYGIYDQERLKNTLRRHEDDDDLVLAISIDGLHALEQFVLAKYYMTTQVYRHKIRLITDSMIQRGIELGIREDKLGWLASLYAYDGTAEFVKNYLHWYDERLSTEILHSPDGYARDMLNGSNSAGFSSASSRQIKMISRTLSSAASYSLAIRNFCGHLKQPLRNSWVSMRITSSHTELISGRPRRPRARSRSCTRQKLVFFMTSPPSSNQSTKKLGSSISTCMRRSIMREMKSGRTRSSASSRKLF